MILLLSSTALASKNDAVASSMIERARELSDIRAEGAPAFRLRMSISITKEDGAEIKGFYTEVWSSKTQWRKEIELAEFKRIEVAAGRKRWVLDSSAIAPEHIGEIPALSEFGKFPGKWKSTKDREINGASASCVKQDNDFGHSELCFARPDGTIVVAARAWRSGNRAGERVCSYSDYQKFSDRIFATSYACGENKRRTLRARVVELAAAPSQESSLFLPPSGAKEWVNCLDSVEPPRPLSSPEPPPPTQNFSGTIVVLVSTVIGTDGKAHDLKVTSAPRRSFDETAVGAVREWRFTPGKCGAEPMDTELVVEVAFTHY